MENKNPEILDDGSRILSNKQRLFVGYLNAIFLYLTVINFCEEYFDWVNIKSFTISVLVSILLLFGLMLLITTEKKAANYFKTKTGMGPKVMRGISSYILLVGGKFVIMGVIALLFGDLVTFSGPFHGAIAFVGVVTAILVADGIAKKIYSSLGTPVTDNNQG